MKCYACKKDTVKSWEGAMTVHGVEILARGERCSSCGEVTFSDEEVGRQEQQAAVALAARGVRTGVEFKFLRKMAGLKAVEIADMLDVRPETVSRWERGDDEIPRLAAFALGALYEHPKITRQKLEALAA